MQKEGGGIKRWEPQWGGKEGAGEERGRGTGWKGKKREECRVWPHLQETGLNRSHFPR